MRVAIIGGATGMLGKSLMATVPKDVDIVWKAGRLGSGIQAEEYREALLNTNPDLVINTAAVHDVNNIESNLLWAEGAWRVNAFAVGALATACARDNVRLMHISTDYVLDYNQPVTETAPPNPCNLYGGTKLCGEMLIKPANYMVVRTGALFGPGKNFVETMLAKVKAGEEIRVVRDQRTAPTYTKHLAMCMWFLAKERHWMPKHVVHLMASGDVSWFGFAEAILRPLGVDVLEANSYTMSGAPRPKYSVLETEYRHNIITPPPWRYGLAEYLQDKESGFWNQD